MLESEKLPLKNLQMQRSMPPKARVDSRNEAALPLQKENIAWTTTYAFIAAKQDTSPWNAKPCQINDQALNSAK
jgi:hypothetical protein